MRKHEHQNEGAGKRRSFSLRSNFSKLNYYAKFWICCAVALIFPMCSNLFAGNHFVAWYTSYSNVTDAGIRPIVAYKYSRTANTVKDWMFDGSIITDITLCQTPSAQSATAYINKLFATGSGNHQISDINTIVGNIAAEMSQTGHKWKVVLTVPYVPGDSSATCANIQTLISDWNTLAPANLELAGFYWGGEYIATSESSIVKAAADLVHVNGLSFWWIPYFNAISSCGWAVNNFDYVTLQPNYAFLGADYLNAQRFNDVNADITAYALDGSEIETTQRNNALSEVMVEADYMHYAEQYKWNDMTMNTYYFGQRIAGYASSPFLGAAYDDLYRYMTPSLRLQWHFAEGSGTSVSDSSCHTNDGTVTGPTWTTGLSGGALLFDGMNDYVSTPDSPSLHVTGTLSFEAWIYPTEAPAQYGTIMGRDDYWRRMMLATNLSIRVEMRNSFHQTAANAVTLNAWNHIVYTSDGTHSYIYVNGTQSGAAGTGEADFTPRVTGQGFRIGTTITGGYPFQGRIDEVRVYSRVITPEEVSRNYIRGIRNADVVAALTFDETNDSLVYDSTQHAHTAVNEKANLQGPIHVDVNTSGINRALSFDGINDYVLYPDRDSLHVTGALSFEAWIYPTALPLQYGTIMGRDDYFKRMMLKTDRSIRVETLTKAHQTAANVVTLNAWNHVVYTSDGTTSHIYVNGAQVGSTGNGEADFTPRVTGQGFRIGTTITGAYPFQGRIGEIRVYSRVLRPAEIQAYYNSVQ